MARRESTPKGRILAHSSPGVSALLAPPPGAAATKQNCIVSHCSFWRLEVQGVCGTLISLDAVGENLCRAFPAPGVARGPGCTP